MKKGLIVVATLLFLGFLLVFAPSAKAAATPEAIKVVKKYEEFDVHTTLYGGNMERAMRDYLLPLYKKLESGRVPGDKITWSFKKSPFYVENDYEISAESRMNYFAYFYTQQGGEMLFSLNKDPQGMWLISGMDYTIQTRKVGEDNYRSVITSISVTRWRGPDERECSRSKAVACYGKYEKVVKDVVSKVIAARYNGKPLNAVQRLKAIHDWLVFNVEYDTVGIDAFHKGDKRYKVLFNEYGALVNRKAVCKGYALAFKVLVDELVRQTNAKIKCEFVYDTLYLHVWNRVKLGNQWYHVDATWDDPLGGPSTGHTAYFLVSDNGLLPGHPGKKAPGYYTYYPERAADSRYEGMEWPFISLYRSEISGMVKSTKKYKLGKAKSARPFDKTFKPFAKVYRYYTISTNVQMVKGLALKRGLDYSVSYSHNKKKGWGTAVITLKGGYSGKIKIKFKIV